MAEQTDRPPGTTFVAAAALIFRMAVSVGILAILGDLLDRWLHTAPWFMIAGIVLGVALVIVELEIRASRYRRGSKKVRRKKKKKTKRAGGGPKGGD